MGEITLNSCMGNRFLLATGIRRCSLNMGGTVSPP